MRKHLFLLLLLISISNILHAQQKEWIDMFSYANLQQILVTNNKVYGIAENSFFTYDIPHKEITKFSSIQGLVGNEIAQTYYSNDLKKHFIIYKNGFIQIINSQNKIKDIPDLFFNSFIPQNKKVCHAIAADNNILYLAMEYGISEFDLEKNEFKDTYFIGNGGSQLAVKDIAFKDPYIYAATPNGLKKANKNDLLINYNNWQNIDPNSWQYIEKFQNILVGIKNNKDLYKIENNSAIQFVFHSNASCLNLQSNEYLNLATAQSIIIFNESLNNIKNFSFPNGVNGRFTTAQDYQEKIYAGTNRRGIFSFDMNLPNEENILPDGPAYNDPFGVDALENQVWVVYGKHSPSFNPYPLLQRDVSHFNGNHWNNIPYQNIQARSLCYVKINPSSPDEVYISSGHDGLIKIEKDQTIIHFDETNSSLDYFVSNGDKNIRTFGLNFDKENNLYVTQTGTSQPIKVLYADGSWGSLSFSPGFFNPNQHTNGIRALKISNHILWAGTVYKGVLGYNLDDSHYISIKNGIEPQNYPNIQALDLDYTSRLWVGNHRMLRYLPSPENVFSNPAIDFKPVKIEFQGSVQFLLEGESITKILTDGLNNKWIGTSGSGVYYVSEDAKKILKHFTLENSPLPSNEIYDMALDDKTGNIFIATAKGLIGYKSKAFAPAEDLSDVYAFPNPVLSQKHKRVTIKGLIRGVNVKIVDIEGNLVFEEKSKGGSVFWDLSAFKKYKVASGVYIVLITNEDGTKTQTTKILVIK